MTISTLKMLPLSVVALFAMLATPVPVHADPLQCGQMQSLFTGYFDEHYQVHQMTDEIKARTIHKFISALDPSKATLLQEDVDKLTNSLTAGFQGILSGKCDVVEDATKVVLGRAAENLEFVRKLVGADFKIDTKLEFVLNPDKRKFAATVAEKNDYLAKLVHFQMAGYQIAKMKPENARKQLTHRYELAVKRLKERSVSDQLGDFAEAFALALDPHSSFLSQDTLEDFQIQMRLSLEGIGASLSTEDGFTIVEEVIPGGAADRDKQLKVKDKIIAVKPAGDGEPVSTIDMELRSVVAMIRGKKGTKVGLTILREGEKTETLQISLTRDTINIEESAAKITYEDRKVGGRTLKIGILDLPSFYGGNDSKRSSSGDLKKLIDQAKKKKVDGLVLDLSRNGGGLLDEAVKVSGLFMRLGNVVATQDSRKRTEVLADQDEEIAWSGPLVVLISRLSASASEILAGALQDYHRALIVGDDHTFGKGTVQSLLPLRRNIGAMKVTIGMFFIPAGNSTQRVGVPSDIQIPSVFNVKEIGEGSLDYALPPLTIPRFVSDDANFDAAKDPGKRRWTPAPLDRVTKLAAASKARVEKNPKFAEIRKQLKDNSEKEGKIKLAEFMKEKDEKEAKESAKDSKDSKGKASKDGKDSKDSKDSKDAESRKKKRRDSSKELEKPVMDEAVNILADVLAG